MESDTTIPHDCGHPGALGGICQHDGCADELCADCVADCDSCGNTLCPPHQRRLTDGSVLCPSDVTWHVGAKLLRRLVSR
jgi:hypothetical protein